MSGALWKNNQAGLKMFYNKLISKLLWIVCFAFLLLAPAQVFAIADGMPRSIEDIRRIKADNWSITGRNLYLKGNITIPAKDLQIHADEAIVNLDSQDIEAFGNITVCNWKPVKGTVTPSKLASLEKNPDAIIQIDGITGNIWGEKKINVSGRALTDTIVCDSMAGNIKTGYYRFVNLTIRFKSFGCHAAFAERTSEGIITAHDARISGCSYIEHGNDHYSFSSSKMVFKPTHDGFYDLNDSHSNLGDYSVWMTNSFARVYGVPVLWLPVFYKPKDESPGLFTLTWGKNSDWGYYLSAHRRFSFADHPQIGVDLFADFMTERGVGYGVRGWFRTEESRTELFAYSIHDRDPFASDDYDDYRLRVPVDRYMFRLTNTTHITPRLDFRAQLFWVSDFYFTKDFFEDIYGADTQPSTFAALEHQFDNFSASVIFRPRVNKFYTTVEQLPAARIDIPRQELFGTGVYYQGDMSAGHYRTRWIDFNRVADNFEKLTGENSPYPYKSTKLKDYQSFRFDTTHFLYFPVNLDWINFVPRIGFKLTAYGRTSKEKVTTNDLLALIEAANPLARNGYELRNYDDDGGSKVRFAGEIGFELSTKIHNTWNDVKINWMQIDGLRHIMRPYINYTFIGVSGVRRDHIYYFDDIDRIDHQNFFRFGLENRLQTRTETGIRTIFSMENFWDLHFRTASGFGEVEEFGHVGDFGTIVSINPLRNLTISSSFLISFDDHNGEVPDTIRNGRNVGKTGLNLKWLNRWNISVTYKPIDDVTIRLSYVYNRPYSTRTAYSMGSTLSQIESGSYFDRYYDTHNEVLTLSLSMPLTPDRRTFGAVSFTYDFYDGEISYVSFSIMRRFHCVELMALVGFERDDGELDFSFSMTARLLALEAPLGNVGNELLRIATSRSASTVGIN